jgi:hypothetical protein
MSNPVFNFNFQPEGRQGRKRCSDGENDKDRKKKQPKVA